MRSQEVTDQTSQAEPEPRDPASPDHETWESAANAVDSAVKEEIWEEVFRPDSESGA